jgi:hypothetical protein
VKAVHALRVSKKSARAAMNMLPAKSQQILDRKVRRYTNPARESVIRNVVGPLRRDQVAFVRYAAVLDGHTLNLHAELPIPDSVAADRADLFLVQGPEHHRIPVRLYRTKPGFMLIDATILLGSAIGGLPLGHGRWDMRVLVTSNNQPVQAFGLEGPLRARSTAGPTRRPPVSVMDGNRYRIRLSPLGLCRLHVDGPVPFAEIEHVELRHSYVQITFRAVGAHPSQAVSVEIVGAGGGGTAQILFPTADPDVPNRFSFDVPLDRVPDDGATHIWAFHARTGERRGLPLAHVLSGVRVPGRVFKMKPLLVATPADALVHVRPYYTSRGHLHLECSTVAPAARPGVAL